MEQVKYIATMHESLMVISQAVLCVEALVDEIGESVNSGLDYWNGLLDWTTGLTFDLKFTMFAVYVWRRE